MSKQQVPPGTIIRFSQDTFTFRGDKTHYSLFRREDDKQYRHHNIFTRLDSRGEPVPGLVQLRKGWVNLPFEVVGVDGKEIVPVSVFG